ncbi:MAG TPA: glycosyl hydrolase family 28-related protein, partial [Flavobacterium sp.]|nr:glycosyl hydrolase family 28-related protein [Flavobacterium sp.]
MPEVQIPKFKSDTLNIIDFGAVPNTEQLCTNAINSAIEKCSKSGGGVVVIPAGLWTTGPIKLKSNVNLHTQNGAFVSFTSDLKQYKLIESYFEGNKVIRCESPIMGVDLENIAITGQGIFDGNGAVWRPVKIGKMTSGQWNDLVNSGGVLSKDGKIWYPSKGAYE